MSIQTGDSAPDFTLKNTNGVDVNLSSFKGNKKVVLLFFPLAYTGVCTTELCTIRDSMKQYEDLNAEVLAVSVDSFFTLKEFKQAQNLNFQLLSDFNKEVAHAYDCLYEEFFGMKGVAKRSAFVIDEKGIVKYTEVLEKASDLPDFDKIKAALA
ncbi:MAG: peroxiredoxin [Balneolales bacterium]|nr:peroxiredoxin [Balneolales bacterium]